MYMSMSMSDLAVVDEYVCVNNVGELKPIWEWMDNQGGG